MVKKHPNGPVLVDVLLEVPSDTTPAAASLWLLGCRCCTSRAAVTLLTDLKEGKTMQPEGMATVNGRMTVLAHMYLSYKSKVLLDVTSFP